MIWHGEQEFPIIVTGRCADKEGFKRHKQRVLPEDFGLSVQQGGD